jgi:protein SCO1/2
MKFRSQRRTSVPQCAARELEAKMQRGLRPIFLAIWLPLAVLVPAAAMAHGDDGPAERLARIGTVPDFMLTTQSGTTFSTADLRGKVVAVNFVFTRCGEVCPLATDKMVGIQQELGDAFGRDVYFVSVTVDPEHDTPAVLEEYARAFGSDLSGWAFLTGAPTAIREVARSYGVVYRPLPNGEVEHILLTSLIDREGILRVQYMGERFDPSELLHDLRDLMDEDTMR